jgi:hypothetical protein
MPSGFDTLDSFQNKEFTIKPIQAVNPVTGVQGGTFTVNEAREAEKNKVKDEIGMDAAMQAVDQTPIFNQMALDAVNSYIPVRQQMEENVALIAQQMGIGERVTFDQALSEIQSQLGPLPKTKGIDKGLNFLVDSINARTPYQGAAGIFDIIAQATGKYIDRETAEKSARISHGLKTRELAIKQMQDQNAAILAKEADFFLKKMGMEDDYLQKFYSQTNEIQKQINQFNLDDLKAKQKASYDLFANPMRLYNNVTFMTPDGPTVSTSKLVFNEDKGEYEIMLPRQTDSGDIVFDQEAPPDAYFSPEEGPQTDAGLLVGGANFGQVQQLVGDFDTLGRAGDLVVGMFEMDQKALESGAPSRFGIEGAVEKLKQETQFTLRSLFNAINPGAGDMFVKEGNTLYEKDKALYQLQPGEEERFVDFTFQAPKKGVVDNILKKVPGVSDFEPVTRRVSIDDFFGDRGYGTYRSLGYSEDFARLKVQENLIIYALARALKPTGRLNVDDIKRASDLVNLQGFTSPEYVRGQLKEILRFIRKAQVDLYGQGQIGDRNVFDQEYYGPMVEKYKQFLGQTPPMSESPKIEPNIENPPAEDPTQQEVTYNGEIFTMGDNI